MIALDADKERFVREWIKHRNPNKAALIVYPNDQLKSLMAATQWQRDPQCLLRFNELLISEGEAAFLPTKAELARMALDLASEQNANGNPAHKAKDRKDALRLCAEILGYIERPMAQEQTGDDGPPTIIISPDNVAA